MEKFEFQPEVQSSKEILDISERKNSVAAWVAIALAAVLKKCGNKLEESSDDRKLPHARARRRCYRLISVEMS